MTEEPTRLFVYGIFLDERNRQSYGMTDPEYQTVADFATVGGRIVKAVHIPQAGLALTGVAVEYNPEQWERLDRLEGGYDRIIVKTTQGEPVYMYAEHDEAFENHSTYTPLVRPIVAM
jgi:gamma-glutamylcyclotransferase (GGCT)/AIG2-like uncharacterized protein YtfP